MNDTCDNCGAPKCPTPGGSDYCQLMGRCLTLDARREPCGRWRPEGETPTGPIQVTPTDNPPAEISEISEAARDVAEKLWDDGVLWDNCVDRSNAVRRCAPIIYDAITTVTADLQGERDGWHRVVVDIERLFDTPDTAKSPIMSNAANLVRDLKAENTRLKLLLGEDRKVTLELAASIADGYCQCATRPAGYGPCPFCVLGLRIRLLTAKDS